MLIPDWRYRLRQLRHRLIALASYLPDAVLNKANHRWPASDDTFEGFWFDAHYWKHCRTYEKVYQERTTHD